jgi:hypothetical protein
LSAEAFVCSAVAESSVGYLVFGIERTSDPVQIRAALDGMADMQMPPGFEPYQKSLEITGVVTVDFRPGSRRSYVKFATGPRFQLQHTGTRLRPQGLFQLHFFFQHVRW